MRKEDVFPHSSTHDSIYYSQTESIEERKDTFHKNIPLNDTEGDR